VIPADPAKLPLIVAVVGPEGVGMDATEGFDDVQFVDHGAVIA
jgi:hypothetical protein